MTPMIIAVAVGVVSGTVGVLCWTLVQLALTLPGIYNQLGNHWYLVPPAIGVLAAGLHALSRAFYVAKGRGGGRGLGDSPERSPAFADIFESYHFGTFVLQPLQWLTRGVISLLNAFLGGTFGVEGGILELSYATLPLFSRSMRLFIEEKQTFVICTVAASLGVALGAPFTGGLIALELFHVLEARVRAGAILAALTGYGTATLLQSSLLARVFGEGSVERLTLLGSLFEGLRPLNIELSQWVLISVAAICVGICTGVLASLNSTVLARSSEYFGKLFGRRFLLGQASLLMIVTGLLMGVSVWLVPESFTEPWRQWEDLAWLRLSTPAAFLQLVGKWTLLVLAFSGWGSTGLFSPVLLLGAVFGYSLGNGVASAWALPLAIAGAASALAATFRVPIAAAALVLELGHDAQMWWLSTLAVASSYIVVRVLKVKPLHEQLLARVGMRVMGGRAAHVLASLKTSDAMYRNVRTVSDHASLQELREASAFSNHNFLGVVSQEGRYLGLLALEQLPVRIRHALRADAKPAARLAVEGVLEIRELMDTYGPTVSPNDTLEKALGLLQNTPCVAVVDEQWKLCGFVFESSIAGRYKREIASQVIRDS